MTGFDHSEARLAPHLSTASGEDALGRVEAMARFLGTPKYIAAQAAVVIAWIALNALAIELHWDPDPFTFVLLSLALSAQAAFMAPLMLLAQTRQADRDREARDYRDAHHEELMSHIQERTAAIRNDTAGLKQLIEAHTALTQEDKVLTEKVAAMTREIHTDVASR
jgi:uncharacterized membrane protein